MEEDAYRPLIPGQERIDQKLFDWNMKNDLEAHMKVLGIESPDVRKVERGGFIHQLLTDYLHIPPIDGALLMDARALGTRGERLGPGADEWLFARRQDGDNLATVPLEYALGMRGVAYGLPDREPETVRKACANRIAQRIAGDENAVVREIDGVEKIVIPDPTGGDDDQIVQDLDVRLGVVDGRECVLLPTNDARVLLAPIALGDPAAKFSTKRQTLTPDAEGFDGENGVFLVQAAKLAYKDQDTISLYTEAWGLKDAKLCDHEESDGQAFVAYDEEKNTIVVSFRGTESRADVFVDADFGLERSEHIDGIEIPSGFKEQFEGLLPKIKAEIDRISDEAERSGKGKPSFMVGGHSLGGALGGIWTLWALQNDLKVTQLYTCGGPGWANRQGAQDFDALLAEKGCNYFRFVNNNDIVPRVPPSAHHSGVELYINHHGKLEKPGLLSGGKRALDRLAGIVQNWSMSSGIDNVDSISDHYVDFYLGYARKNRAVDFVLGAAGRVLETMHDLVGVATDILPGGGDDK